MDAWIEIINSDFVAGNPNVASFMDAWIEIKEQYGAFATKLRSHPLWMRGLKCLLFVGFPLQLPRRILYGCVD